MATFIPREPRRQARADAADWMKIIEVDGFEANHPYTRLDLPDFRRHLLTGTSAAGQ